MSSKKKIVIKAGSSQQMLLNFFNSKLKSVFITKCDSEEDAGIRGPWVTLLTWATLDIIKSASLSHIQNKYGQCSLTDPVLKKINFFPWIFCLSLIPFCQSIVIPHIELYGSQEDLNQMGYKRTSNLWSPRIVQGPNS